MIKKLSLLLLSISFFFLFANIAYGAANFNISLISPTDDSWKGTNRNVNFTFNPGLYSGNEIRNCSIWSNATGVWNQTITNNSQSYILNSSSLSYINYSFSTDGIYLWAIECYDGAVTPDSNMSKQ
ncbi:MAG: hypothetical protein AABY22_20505, partial [Nanoarchaeota archaeon]